MAGLDVLLGVTGGCFRSPGGALSLVALGGACGLLRAVGVTVVVGPEAVGAVGAIHTAVATIVLDGVWAMSRAAPMRGIVSGSKSNLRSATMPDDILPFDKTRGFRSVPPHIRRTVARCRRSPHDLRHGRESRSSKPMSSSRQRTETATPHCSIPLGSGSWPGAVIFADALGLRPAFRDMGRRLALEGYTVLVPNPFYRTRVAPVLSGPFDFSKPEDRAKLTDLMAATNRRGEGPRRHSLHCLSRYLASGEHQGADRRVRLLHGRPLHDAHCRRSAGTGRCRRVRSMAAISSLTKPDSPHLLAPTITANYYFADRY